MVVVNGCCETGSFGMVEPLLNRWVGCGPCEVKASLNLTLLLHGVRGLLEKIVPERLLSCDSLRRV